MARKLRFHPDSVDELIAAGDWYRERSELAARAFALEFEHAIKRIRQAPYRYPVYLSDTRRLILPRFPFAVIYRVDEVVIEIVAVAHHKRKPGYWKTRL